MTNFKISWIFGFTDLQIYIDRGYKQINERRLIGLGIGATRNFGKLSLIVKVDGATLGPEDQAVFYFLNGTSNVQLRY